jgi:hypothetical protein
MARCRAPKPAAGMAVDHSVEPVADTEAQARGGGGVLAVGLIAAGLVLLTMVVRYVFALDQTAPWLMGDELRYSDMAKSFLAEGRFHFRESFTSFATAYPALIAPAWAAADVETAYELAKAINVVLLTSTAGVVFLWARRLAATPYAGVAAGLVLLMPTFTYTGMLMMENAALPAFLLGAFVLARGLERPTVGWQLAIFPAIGLASLLRIQLVTLVLVYLTAVVLVALFEWRAGVSSIRSAIWRFRVSLGVFAGGALAYLVYKLLSDSPLASGLGAYSEVGESNYDLVEVARWSLWHVGELALSVGFLPAAAFGALLGLAVARGGLLPTAADRAFVAVTAATVFWFVLQAAAFASRYTQRIEERYMVYAAPLLLMALAVWVGRALPRRTLPMLAAALLPALFALTIPFQRLFNVSLLADTFGLIPFMRLWQVLDGSLDELRLVLAVGLALCVVAFVVLRPRLAGVLFPAAVALFFVLSGNSVYSAIGDQSAGARASSGVADPSWVDDTLGRSAEVGFIYTPGMNANPHLLYQTEFWNRSVRDVYAFRTDNAATFQGPEIQLSANGALVPKAGPTAKPVDEPYVLAEPTLGIVGDVVAKPGPLALIRVDPPLRIENAIDGIAPDRWSGEVAGLSQFAPLPRGARHVRVKVSREGWGGPDLPGNVVITAAPLRVTESGHVPGKPTATRRWTVHSSQARTFDVPVPPAPFRVEVRVTPTFSPSQFGFADTRQLGAQLSFETG